MSHIHLPDGILPLWLWLAGFGVTALLIAVLWQGGRATASPRRFARLGIFAATMVLVMLIELPPLSYHFNLSVVSGIILGPQLAVIAALMVNIVLALIGHGGITVLGLNALVLMVEMLVGYGVFRLLSPRLSLGKAGFLATLAGLVSGAATSFGVVAIGSPWINRVLRAATLAPGEELGPGITGAHLDLLRLAIFIFGFGAIGWVVEGLLSASVLNYFHRVYPGLIEGEE